MSRTRTALAVAALAAVGAAAAIAVIVTGLRTPAFRSTLLGAAAAGAVAEPVYYVPLKAVPAGAAQTQLGMKQPVVYYYVPEKAAGSLKQASLITSLANATGAAGNATAAAPAVPAFVCSKDNIKALSTAVQTKWTACEKAATDYKEPNKGAKRRLLGWVWEGPGNPTMLANATAPAGNATPAAAAGPTLSDCMKKAIGEDKDNACVKVSTCKDPVCSSYYNEPEIEALCGMCTMGVSSGLFGCFARDATTVAVGRGTVAVGDLKVGDSVMAAGADGAIVSSRVYFIHDHKEAAQTVQLHHAAGMLEMTPSHMIPVYTEACGDSYCADADMVAAKEIQAGSRVYVQGKDTSVVQEITQVTKSSSMVRYVLTEAETAIVNGVVASVHSTAAGSFETTPFRLADLLFPGSLQWSPLAASLAVVLESPILQKAETVFNAIAPLLSRPVFRAERVASSLVVPQASF